MGTLVLGKWSETGHVQHLFVQIEFQVHNHLQAQLSPELTLEKPRAFFLSGPCLPCSVDPDALWHLVLKEHILGHGPWVTHSVSRLHWYHFQRIASGVFNIYVIGQRLVGESLMLLTKQREILGTSSGDFRCISRDCPGESKSKCHERAIHSHKTTRRRTSSGKTVLPHPEVAEDAVGGPQSCKWLSWVLQGTTGGCLEGSPHWVSQESATAGHAGISPSSSAVHLIPVKTAGWPQRVSSAEQYLLPIQHIPGANFLHVFTLRMHCGPARNVKLFEALLNSNSSC
ncbi:PREDICTED: LOW QUALITY PROTEIN: uncharacterized protein LOC105545855 [Mandrillus leucophaeus]|uniref:LOW QUALITY PROTEIN: uncharacterized protein LOC105545855 n=1 Tax=Mandrillus leucophaeus TaxID=9568 RepID=UPI0005F4079F|nr:PREDICTED: LOW QUALITY PROTEIN: uncharacterized protein LOC105545855 [Mandrillus leucophaeus]